MRQPKYKIGTKFRSPGKNSKICTVVDIHTTYDSKGELVKIRYVAEHLFLGQPVIDYVVPETTITRGLIQD